MRLVYLVNQFPPHVTAGLGRYVEAMAPRLTGAGHRLTVCTPNPGDLPEHTDDGRLTVFRPHSRLLGPLLARRPRRTDRGGFIVLTAQVALANLRYVAHLRRVVRREGVDVVAVHDATNALAALVVARWLRLPLVFHVHTVEYSLAPPEAQGRVRDPGGLFRRLEARLGRAAWRIVVPSPELRDQLVGAGWDGDRTVVVPLGRPFAAPDPARVAELGRRQRAELGLPPDALVVGYVGRLERLKGVYPLVEALPELARRHPTVVLALAGEGDREGLQRLARRAGCADRLRLADRFLTGDDLVSWYAAADVCCFPSLVEPFGLVALEAMTLARPTVLGTAFSSLFAGDGPEPAVATVRPDAADISRVVGDLLADPGRRTALGRRGAAQAARFDWDDTAATTLAVYEQVVALSPGGRRRAGRRPARR